MIEAYLKKHKPTQCPAQVAFSGAPVYPTTKPHYDVTQIGSDYDSEFRRIARLKIAKAFEMLGQWGRGNALTSERQYAANFLMGAEYLDRWCKDAGLPYEMVRQKAREIIARKGDVSLCRPVHVKSAKARAKDRELNDLRVTVAKWKKKDESDTVHS